MLKSFPVVENENGQTVAYYKEMDMIMKFKKHIDTPAAMC